MFQFSSVQFSPSVTPDSPRPHELQHARPPCPSPCLKTIKYFRVDAWGGRGIWEYKSWKKETKKERQGERERERGLAWNDDKNLLRTGDYDQLNSQPPEVQLNK